MTTLFPMTGDLADARRDEFKFCIQQNLANPDITNVVILWENFDEEEAGRYPLIKDRKVIVVPCSKRPTYGDFIREATERFPGKVVAICNTDIFFDDTLDLGHSVPYNAIYSITRLNWDPDDTGNTRLQGDGLHGSSDVWILKTPLPKFYSNIMLGVIGCDTYFGQKALEAGVKVFNPCYSIRAFHLHRVGVRNDQPGGLRYWNLSDYRSVIVGPCKLDSLGVPCSG